MLPYTLTLDAEKDLREVARYTRGKWGDKVLGEYRAGLKKTFEAIGSGDIQKRPFSKKFPQLFVTKYRYHYIFYVIGLHEKPAIIGVIHERRDIVNRLAERLE